MVLVASDPRELARLLVDAGVHMDNAHCGDWREGGSYPGAGTAITLKVEMRLLLGLLPAEFAERWHRER